VDEYGTLETPILLTSTHSVGVVHTAVVEWLARHEGLHDDFVIPIVAETFDGFLNDTRGQHVTREHVLSALDTAASGPVAEGNVGGGTGMSLFQLKGGIGTASRVVEVADRTFTVGVLLQGNYGRREHLRVDGVALAIDDLRPLRNAPTDMEGSVVVVVATDAPLTDRQLARVARRAMLGIGRSGGIAGHTSGDLVLAFSNPPEVRVARRAAFAPDASVPVLLTTPRLHDAWINPLFEATIEATEEAVLNALVAARTMVGRRGNTLYALPHDRLDRAPKV
jgi:D-aminopeptidase